VVTQAGHHGAMDDPNILSNLSVNETEAALMECKDVDSAIEKCRKNRGEIVSATTSDGDAVRVSTRWGMGRSPPSNDSRGISPSP
jgi:hypothetical protein